SCYSLEGAVYGVYTDYACENPVLDKNGDPVRLITNAAGQSTEVELPSAWYYVKEISAPKGYMLDDLAHDVQVTGESTVLELEDVPLNDPFAVRIQKVDANTGEPVAPGGASLALAEYTFDYYADVYTSAEEARSSGAPTASYVMRTDGDGYVSLILGDESFDLDGHNYDYKVSGPDFIKDAMTGIITSPLGSWVVYETKAPKGFLLSDEVFFAVLDANAEGQVGWNAPNVFTDPNNPDEATFRALEAPAAYGIKLDKRLEGVPNETSPEGIRFDIVSKTTGETVVTLTIGADGTASTQEDTLPYDIYEVYEDESSLPKNESGDYLIQPFSWTNEDNSNLVATIDMADYDNGSIITVDACDYTSERIVVKKTDRDSGEAISGTRFQLWRYPASVVDGVIELDVNDISADDPAWENIGSVSTDSAGIADFGWKGYGIYKIVESQAATAYMNPSEMGEDGFIIFKLDKNNSYQEQVFTDKAINLGCEVSKSTLDVTSAGLIYRDVDGNEVSNVGVEEYRYDVTFRSTANTWADEFYVIDECQMTGKPYGLRITKLWLPTVSGDTDGRLHLLIRTGGNSAAGMSFSQPELHEGSLGTADRFDASGWDYVGEFSASSREAVDLSAYGDIKGIALCFGAVEEGFCSLEPLSYLVTATHELEAGTVIPNSVTSHISRNWSDGGNGLKDDDSDSVETRVISTFEVSFDEYVVERSGGTHGTWISRLLPQTGDGAPLLLFIVVLGLSLLGFITMLVYHTHGNRKEREG
ncbi:MAG: hypothetical protein IJH83_09375, partial [Coriobacteriales bacterium]|nr:hypothetical protein [Coriobacteriales bacterium]